MTLPKVNTFHFSRELTVGMRTAVFCTVIKGDPPFTFVWLKDGEKLQDSKHLNIKSIDDFTSSLTVTNLGPEHNGNYTCRVSNAAGYDERSDVLSMKGNLLHFSIVCIFNYSFIYNSCICSWDEHFQQYFSFMSKRAIIYNYFNTN